MSDQFKALIINQEGENFTREVKSIDKSFLKLSDNNLQILLIGNIALLILLFFMIFSEVRNSLKIDVDVSGSKANRKYITFFALFTLIPVTAAPGIEDNKVRRIELPSV